MSKMLDCFCSSTKLAVLMCLIIVALMASTTGAMLQTRPTTPTTTDVVNDRCFKNANSTECAMVTGCSWCGYMNDKARCQNFQATTTTAGTLPLPSGYAGFCFSAKLGTCCATWENSDDYSCNRVCGGNATCAQGSTNTMCCKDNGTPCNNYAQSGSPGCCPQDSSCCPSGDGNTCCPKGTQCCNTGSNGASCCPIGGKCCTDNLNTWCCGKGSTCGSSPDQCF